jgi:cobalt-zinc-cadmium efflux system membrane fusion protein
METYPHFSVEFSMFSTKTEPCPKTGGEAFMSILGLARRLAGVLPTLTVLALLGSVLYLGHVRGWHLEQPADKKDKKADDNKPEGNGDEPPILGQNEDSPFGSLPITHDPQTCELDKKEIKFKDAGDLRKAGIYLAKVEKRPMDNVLIVTASVDHDPTRVARVSARAGGIIRRITKKEGDDVNANELLAIVESGEVGKAKSAFFQAKVQLDLKQQVRARLQAGLSSEGTILLADSALREARVQLQTAYQALLNLGLKVSLADAEKATDAELLSSLQFLGLEKDIDRTLSEESTNNLLAVRNPMDKDGDVLQRDGVTGEAVAAGQMIFVVGDCSRMLLLLDIRQEDQHLIKAGDEQKHLIKAGSEQKHLIETGSAQKVAFIPDGYQGEPIVTKIAWIAHDLDPKTRAVKACAYIPNKNHQLKAHAFGKAIITIRSKKEALAVPEEAVQWEGCSHIVFVRMEKAVEKKSEADDGNSKKVDEKSDDQNDEKVVFKARKVKLRSNSAFAATALSKLNPAAFAKATRSSFSAAMY